MSAICGVVRFDGQDVAPGMAKRMAQAMKHRGADGIDAIDLGRLALGHCVMHVNVEDVHEAQPIVDRDAVLVADLRLDNREELAATLGIAAVDLPTMPDSEILLYAWKRWGDDCAAHLLGDFAFAIWDRSKGSLLLGRDHMGQRVVLYHRGDGFVAFATELLGLFAAQDVPRRLNENELARRLLVSTERVEGEMMYDAIRALPGGATLRFDSDGNETLVRYWEPHAGAEHVGQDHAHFISAYRKTIEAAVACRARRLISPPTLLFSGGFDSGIIAAIAGPMMQARGTNLTCAASVLPEGDLRRDARRAVEAFRGLPGLDIRYYVRGDETSYDDLEEKFAATGRWIPPSVARQGLGRIAKAAGSRLALDGHGGDYTINPYDTAMLGAILRHGQFRRFVREFRARMKFTGWSPIRVFGRDVLGALIPDGVRKPWRTALNGFVPAWRRRGVAHAFAQAKLAAGVVDATKLRDGYFPGERWQSRWLGVLRRASMTATGSDYGHGIADLDLTRPFHDKRIVELALALPDDLRFRDGRERWLARHAFADRLPRDLIERMPGNDREEPDAIAMNVQAAPAMLASVRAMEDRDSVKRYIDVDALEKMLTDGVSDTKLRERVRLGFAMQTLATARFIAWLDRSNK